MTKAVWNGVVLAQTGETVAVENNHYFPPEAVSKALLKPSDTTTICPWKGTAHYYAVIAAAREAKPGCKYNPVSLAPCSKAPGPKSTPPPFCRSRACSLALNTNTSRGVY